MSENQILRLLSKQSTTNLKGFTWNTQKVEGLIRFDENFHLKLEPKKATITKTAEQSDKVTCPKCETGSLLKGKTAYGCSDYKKGCDFLFTFENIKKKANGKPLTKALVLEIISA